MKTDITDIKSNSSFISWLFLGLVGFFFIILNVIWLSEDTLPFAWDQSTHASLSLEYYRIFIGAKSTLFIKDLLKVSHYYPPFFHISALPIIFLFGFSEHNLIFVNFFYLLILILSIFGIGKLLFNERVGILAATLTFFYPIVFALSREYLIDFALIAVVAAAQYSVLKSEGGFKKYWNIVLGFLVGFALLTKPSSAIFIFPLWLVVFLLNFQKQKLFSVFLSCLISAIIAGPWYFISLRGFLKMSAWVINYVTTVERDPVNFLPSVLWYVNALIYTIISPNLMLLFLVGLCFFLILDRRWKVFYILSAWLVPAFFILVLTPSKDQRYIMPALPAIALFTIGGIDVLNKYIRNILFIFIILIGCIQFNDLSFGSSSFLIKDKSNYNAHKPYRQDWRNEEVIIFLSNHFGKERITIGVLTDHSCFNAGQVAFYSRLLQLPYSIESIGRDLVSFSQIKKFDVFITKYPNISNSVEYFYREKRIKELNEFGMENLGFKEIAQFLMPDQSKVFIYKNTRT